MTHSHTHTPYTLLYTLTGPPSTTMRCIMDVSWTRVCSDTVSCASDRRTESLTPLPLGPHPLGAVPQGCAAPTGHGPVHTEYTPPPPLGAKRRPLEVTNRDRPEVVVGRRRYFTCPQRPPPAPASAVASSWVGAGTSPPPSLRRCLCSLRTAALQRCEGHTRRPPG